MKAGAATGGGTRRLGMESILTIAQVAVTVLLVAAMGTLVRSLHALEASDAGFRKKNVLLFYLDARGTKPDAPVVRTRLLERFQALPGVTTASFSTASPLGTDEESRPISTPGATRDADSQSVLTNRVSPRYFGVFGIPVLRGRAFTEQDSATAQRVAIVSETMARSDFGGSDPIGQRIFFTASPQEPVTIVGIARDVQQQTLKQPPPRLVYVPLAQTEETPPLLTAAIGTGQDPRSLERELRAVVASTDPGLLVSYVRTMEQQMATSLTRERVLALLSIGFGLLALVLACVGMYGVMAHAVVRRTREIGIRIALGALPSAVLWQTLQRALGLCSAGLAIGVAGALLLAPTLAAFAHGLSPRDPVTLSATILLLLATALLAAYAPARRAARVDPLRALRTE